MDRNHEQQAELLRAINEIPAQKLGEIMKKMLKELFEDGDVTTSVKDVATHEEDKFSEQNVSKLLLNMGVPTSILGFKYLKTAIPYYEKQREKNGRCSMCHEVYPEVARVHKSTPYKAERAIRHAVLRTWNSGKKELFEEYFGCSVDLKYSPTSSEFIAKVVEYIRFHD